MQPRLGSVAFLLQASTRIAPALVSAPILTRPLQAAEAAVPNESPYVGGADICSWDLALAPRLYLARQGCKLLKASLYERGRRALRCAAAVDEQDMHIGAPGCLGHGPPCSGGSGPTPFSSSRAGTGASNTMT